MANERSEANSLSLVPIFQDLDGETLRQLAESSWQRSYHAGNVLTSEGDPGDSLLVVESGEVRISRFSANGTEIVLAIVEAPDAIGELALIDGSPRSATVIAQTPVTMRIMPRRAFIDVLEMNSTAMLAVMRALSSMVRTTNERLSDVLSLDVSGRVAKWLLSRAAERGERTDGAILVPFELSQGELAAQLGTSRVSINKALKTFETLAALELRSDAILLVNIELLIEYTR